MRRTVLITGGAGFIGSHLADELLAHDYDVRVLDNLSPQVHGENARRPDYLSRDVELIVGDVQDPKAVKDALDGADALFHFAAAVGVGQSMYEIGRYVAVNACGTANLLEACVRARIGKVIVASSMSVYGEGLYRGGDGHMHAAAERTMEALRRHCFELCDEYGHALEPVPTPESKPPSMQSVYALTKFDQEQLCLVLGRTRDIPVTALRFFNVYGPRQALSNPYTGVMAIFAARYLNGKPPLIYEDGFQRRDFVSVYDVARACRLALERPESAGRVINVGSGRSVTVREVSDRMAAALRKSNIEPLITGKYRAGDIRHCFADITLARRFLGYQPKIAFEDGVGELADWLATQVADDRAEAANAELSERGLTV